LATSPHPRVGSAIRGYQSSCRLNFIRRHYRHLFIAGLTGETDTDSRADGFTRIAATAGLTVTRFPPLSLTAPLTVWDTFVAAFPSPAAWRREHARQ